MTEFEIFEALMMFFELSVLASMNFLAIVGAYLAASYIAGRNLPRSIAVGTSIIYTMFLIPPFSGTMGNLRRAYELGAQLNVAFPESVLGAGAALSLGWQLVLFGIPMICGWIGSVYYMHGYVRKREKDDA